MSESPLTTTTGCLDRSRRDRAKTRRATRGATAFLLAAALVLPGQAASAARPGCGEYSFGFEGTRLLNDGISTSAGPFTISLPAGTYDVTMVSHDAHDDHPGQVEQTQEQWYVELDSGYRSPPTNDIPDDTNDMTTVAGAQQIGASTEISVHHLLEGGVNSVDVVCVGFTTVTVREPEEIIRDVQDVVDSPPAEPEAIVPEVRVVVERPPAQLALTGPSELVLAGLGSGLFLLGYGVVLTNVDAAVRAREWARGRSKS